MSSEANDIRVLVSLPDHPKTKRLIRRLGPGAGWFLIRLWLWARDNRPSGDLTGMTSEDIELAIDWNGENDAFVSELVSVRLLDGQEGAYRLHDWADHNPWSTGSTMRSLKAKWNAVKRHHGIAEANRQVPEYARIRAGSTETDAGSMKSDASSTGAALLRQEHSNATGRKTDAPSPSPSPSKSNTPCSPPEGDKPAASKKSKATTLAAYLAQCEAEGVEPIPETDAVWKSADAAGLPRDWVALAWWAFQGRYLANPGDKAKTYTSWPQAFRNSVRENWLKLWWPVDGGGYRLSPAGVQAKREMESAA